MQQYLDLVRLIHHTGNFKSDRTGTGTYSIFGHQMRFNLADGFPLVTAKHTHLKSIIHELLWFLKGETNIRYLKANGVRIWDEWVLKGTEEYRPATLHEVNTRIKAAGLQDEFVEWVKPYWLSEYKEGYEKIQGKTMHVKGGPDIPGSIYWAHPDYDAMAFAWAEERGVSTKTLIAGELGPVYGSQWRSWPNPKIELIEDQEEKARYMASGLTYADWLASGQAKAHVKNESIDQIANLIEMIKKNPDSRRLIVSAWNPAEVDNMALPPCHTMFQFYSNFLNRYELEDVIGKAHLTADYVRFVNDRDCTTDEEVYDAALMFCQEHDLPRRKLSCQLYQRKHNCALVA